MKISNNKNVPLLNKNSQNNNNILNPLIPRAQKNNPQTLNQNIQYSQAPSNNFIKQGLQTNSRGLKQHGVVNNRKMLANQQSPTKFKLAEENKLIKNPGRLSDQNRNQPQSNIKNTNNFQNEYHSISYTKETNNLYTANNIYQNPNSLQRQFSQQSQKNIYLTKSDRNGSHGQIPSNQMMISNTNNFNILNPHEKHIYPQQKIIQSHPIQNQNNSKRYLNTFNFNHQPTLLNKSKSSQNLNTKNFYKLQNSQSDQSQSTQKLQNTSKIRQGKLNLKNKKQNQNQRSRNLQQTNFSNEYYNYQDNNLLSPFMSQKDKKKHNFLRLSKSLQHHQNHKEKLHLHSSRFGNKIDFDRIYDEEDFGSKNEGSQQGIGFDNQSLGESEKQRKLLTSMQSQLKRKKRKENCITSNPQIKLKQDEYATNFKIQMHNNSLQNQPFRVKSNQNIEVRKNIVYQDEYMIQTGNVIPNNQFPFKFNQKVDNSIPQQISNNQLAFKPQAKKADLKQVVNFQVRNYVNPSQQIAMSYNNQNAILNQINPVTNFQHYTQQKIQSNVRPNSSIPQFRTQMKQQTPKNQIKYKNQQTSELILDLNSNIRKQKTIIAQPSMSQRPQSYSVQTQNYQVATVSTQRDQSALKLRHSPSFGAHNSTQNSFLNLNSNLKSKQSLQRHLQQGHLLPQKKQLTNSLSSLLNNQVIPKAPQFQNTETIDNLSQFHIRKDNTKKNLLSKAQSHGLSDLIMGIKPINVTNNSSKVQQNMDKNDNVRVIQRTSSHGLSDLIMGIKPIEMNNKNPLNQQITMTTQKSKNLVNRANSNRSIDSQKGLTNYIGFDDCLPLDSKPSSPQLAFGIAAKGTEISSKNKVSPQNSLPDQYLNLNSKITTLQKLTYNQPSNLQDQPKSKINKKPSFSSQGSLSNLRLNSNSKIVNNFNYNNQQSGSNLKPISQMQSQWQKQSSSQQRTQSNFTQFQQPQIQNMIQSFQKNIDTQKFGNFQLIQMKNPNNINKTNSISNDMNQINQLSSGVFQETGMFNVPSGLLKQSMQKKNSLNQQILPKQESQFEQQYLKLNTKVVQSKGMPIFQQVLNSGKPTQQMTPPQQWLNINREKYSTSEYLNAQQMKKRLENVQKNQNNIYQQTLQQNGNFLQKEKVKKTQLSKLKVIEKQNDEFREKINSISETLLSMTPIALSQEGSSPNRHSSNMGNQPFNIENIVKQNVNQQKLVSQKKNYLNLQQNNQQNPKQQKFEKTAQYPSSHGNNSFDQHIQYEYSEDGSYGNFSKQNKKSSLFLNQNSYYSQNQDLSDTKKITYTYRHTAKKKSHSKMKNRKSSKLSSSISQSSLNSVQSQHKKQSNLYTNRQNKKSISNEQGSKIKTNLRTEIQTNNRDKNNIMYSNSVFSSQQENYHKLPKSSIYEVQSNELQVSGQKNIQNLMKNESANKINYIRVQSEEMLELSSVNSLSFNFVATNNQPSRNSLKQNSVIGSQKNVDSLKLLQKQSDKMQGSKSKVKNYFINQNPHLIDQNINLQNNLYRPILSNKSKIKDIKVRSAIQDKNIKSQHSMQPVQYGQNMKSSKYLPKKNKLQAAEYGISQDSVNYVKIEKLNNSSSMRHSASQLNKKQSICQNYQGYRDPNESEISAILNENFLPQTYYQSRYEIHPSSRQVRYVESPYGNDDSIYGKDSKVIQTMRFNHVLNQGSYQLKND